MTMPQINIMLNKNFINNLNFNNTDKKIILMILFITLGLILQAGAGSWILRLNY